MPAAALPPVDRITDRVAQQVRIRTSGLIRGLKVQQLDGQLVISGRTSSYYHKQLVTHAALDAATEFSIRNDVEVG